MVFLDFGRSALSAGLSLGIMIFPFLELRFEKALKEMPMDLINSSNALGVSQWYCFKKIILPYCRYELVSALILGGNYAMGATAPIIFTGVVINAPTVGGIMEPAMALPYHLYILLTQGISTTNALGTAFVLLVLVLGSNIFARYIALKGKKN